MRDFLTGLAILVIVALVAALVGPLVVDWQARRGEVETVLSEAIGAPVRTSGPISVRLLPSPFLTVGGIELPGGGESGFTAGATRIELAVAPLLRGDIRITDAAFDAPVLTAGIAADGAVTLPPFAPGRSASRTLAIEHLELHDGALVLMDVASGTHKRVDRISGTFRAGALAGPWQGEGRVGEKPFRFATGEAAADGAMRLKASLGGESDTRIEADGTVTLPIGAQPAGYAGKLTLTRLLGVAPAPDKPPPRLTAHAQATLDGRKLTLDTIEVEAGGPDQPLRLTGYGQAELGEKPSARTALETKRIDLDAVANEGATSLLTGLGDVAEAAPIPVHVDVKAAALAYGEEEATDAAAALDLADGRLIVRRLAATAPGESPIAFEGTLSPGRDGNLAVSGHMSASSAHPARLALSLARLGLDQPNAEALARLPSLSAQADVAVTQELVGVRNIRLEAGETRLTGLVRYESPDGAKRGKLDAQIVAEGFDLAALPTLADRGRFLSRTDFGLVAEGRKLRFGDDAAIGSLKAKIEKSADALTIAALDLTGLAGADLTASGQLDAQGKGRITGELKAARAEPVLALAAKVWPAAASLPRGVQQAPLTLQWVAATDPSRPGNVALNVEGAAARAQIEGGATIDLTGGLTAAEAHVGAIEAAEFLNTIGLPVSGDEALGPASLDLRWANGALAVTGAIGPLDVTTVKPYKANDNAPARFMLTSDDARALAPALGLTLPASAPLPVRFSLDVLRGEPSRIAFDGKAGAAALSGSLAIAPEGGLAGGEVKVDAASLAGLAEIVALGPLPAAKPGSLWTSARFGPPPAASLTQPIKVMAKRFALGSLTVRDATLTLSPAPDGAMIALDPAVIAMGDGGRIGGRVKLKRLGGNAAFDAELKVESLPLQTLAPQGGLSGAASGTLRFGGSGESLAQIVASLSGGGTLTFDKAQLAHLDPGAVSAVAKAALGDVNALDAAKLKPRLEQALDGASSPPVSIQIPVSMTGGLVRFGPFTADGGSAVGQGAVNLDLKTLTLEAGGTLTAKTGPPNWQGTPPQIALSWSGPLLAPERTIDPSALATGLAAIQLRHELDRIDAFEREAKARAEEARRQREERERKQAEEARRKAEQEKAAADNAAAEKAARDQAARAQQARPPATSPGAPLELRPPATTGAAQTR